MLVFPFLVYLRSQHLSQTQSLHLNLVCSKFIAHAYGTCTGVYNPLLFPEQHPLKQSSKNAMNVRLSIVPNTKCHMPDDTWVMYNEPQLLCPNCDPTCYGLDINKALFPNMY